MVVRIFFHLFTVVVLTILTQVGGFIYLFSLLLVKLFKLKPILYKMALFFMLYLFFTFLIIPNVAPWFGRVKICDSNKLKPANFATVLFNRNYVVPSMFKTLLNVEKELSKTDIQISYLDANFPFFDGFPLLPHLSHNDGKKLDISLLYEDKTGKISTKQKSFSGYGFFENPKPKEYNQIEKCKEGGFYQYDLAKYLKFGETNKELIFSEKATNRLIKSVLKSPNISKLFIESHLKDRLNLHHPNIRYHGCHAVRHDDHIHIQVK